MIVFVEAADIVADPVTSNTPVAAFVDTASADPEDSLTLMAEEELDDAALSDADPL